MYTRKIGLAVAGLLTATAFIVTISPGAAVI